jgi:hypothetical protein
VFEPNTGREMIPGDGESALAPQIKEAVEKNYDAQAGKILQMLHCSKKKWHGRNSLLKWVAVNGRS